MLRQWPQRNLPASSRVELDVRQQQADILRTLLKHQTQRGRCTYCACMPALGPWRFRGFAVIPSASEARSRWMLERLQLFIVSLPEAL